MEIIEVLAPAEPFSTDTAGILMGKKFREAIARLNAVCADILQGTRLTSDDASRPLHLLVHGELQVVRDMMQSASDQLKAVLEKDLGCTLPLSRNDLATSSQEIKGTLAVLYAHECLIREQFADIIQEVDSQEDERIDEQQVVAAFKAFCEPTGGGGTSLVIDARHTITVDTEAGTSVEEVLKKLIGVESDQLRTASPDEITEAAIERCNALTEITVPVNVDVFPFLKAIVNAAIFGVYLD